MWLRYAFIGAAVLAIGASKRLQGYLPASIQNLSAGFDSSLVRIENEFAARFITPRDPRYERQRLAELSTRSVRFEPQAAAARESGGIDDYRRSHALTGAHTLPGGSLYFTHGIGAHDLAQRVNPYTHKAER